MSFPLLSNFDLSFIDICTREATSDIHNGGLKRFDEILEARWQLKNMITLLDLLKSTAQEILDPLEIELKEAQRKFGRFLNHLPLDLLAETIRFACSNSGVYELINMSHVNRRFRAVVLSMGDMWAQISSDMPMKILQLSLERSRNASLDIEGNLYETYGDDDSLHQANSFITEIARCSYRWEDIRFTMPKSYHRELEAESYGIYVLLSTTLPRNFHVPRLRSLSITHHGCTPDIRNDETNSRARIIEALHFYYSWSAPNLRTLNFYGIVPAPIRGSSVESLSLNLRPSREDLKMDYFIALQDLVAFLRETPSLRTLRLSLHTSGSTYLRGHLVLQATTLDKLRELTLTLSHQWADPDSDEISLTVFTNCIRVPNLSTLRIKLETTTPENQGSYDMKSIINKFTPQHGVISLENLYIFIFDNTPKSTPTLHVELDKYPSIQSLTLGITGKLAVKPGSSLHSNVRRRGSLKQIKLLACMSGTEEFLTWLAGEIGEEGVKRVKAAVKKCESTEKGDISKIFPSDQLEFEECGSDSCLYWFDETRYLGLEYFRDNTEE